MSAAIFGAGANVVGGIMQAVAASQAKRAMANTYKDEIERQQGYRNEAFGGIQPSFAARGVEQARTDIDKGAQTRQAFYNQIYQSPLALKPGQTPRTAAGFKLAGQNRANLGGYSDWALEQMIRSIRSQDELNRISNFAGGDAQVFPYKMYDAQHSADELAFWGNLISSVGGSAGSWSSLFGQGPQQTQQFAKPSVYGIDANPAQYNQFAGQV